MAMTLIEAMKTADNPLRAGIIGLFAQNSDILRVLPFENIEGNAVRYTREDVLPGVGFRGVNEAYSEDVGIVNPQTDPLVIAGGDLDVDNFIVATQGAGQRGARVSMKVKALAHRWTEAFIKGDSTSDPREFDGLQRRLTGNQLLDAGASSGGDALTLAKLDELIDAVDSPTHLVMNKAMRRRLSAAARSTSVGGYIGYQPDEFGRQIMFYNDLPILIADEDNEGNQILPFTEANPGGGSAASTSIYCVSFGDMTLTGIQSGPMDVRDLGEQDSKPVLRTRVEWYAGIACYHGKAAARLRGIKNAAVTA